MNLHNRKLTVGDTLDSEVYGQIIVEEMYKDSFCGLVVARKGRGDCYIGWLYSGVLRDSSDDITDVYWPEKSASEGIS